MPQTEAAHKVVYPGTGLPVATMELVLEEFASKYSSVATVEGAYNSSKDSKRTTRTSLAGS